MGDGALTTVFGAIPISMAAGTIPNGSQSAAQQVSVVQTTNHTLTEHPREGYFNGVNIKIGGTTGTLKVRAFSGTGASAVEIYSAVFAYTVADSTLSDSLGSELVVFQNSCYITLEADAAGMEATINPYIMGGNTACRI